MIFRLRRYSLFLDNKYQQIRDKNKTNFIHNNRKYICNRKNEDDGLLIDAKY